jgi:hypothetical protein
MNYKFKKQLLFLKKQDAPLSKRWHQPLADKYIVRTTPSERDILFYIVTYYYIKHLLLFTIYYAQDISDGVVVRSTPRASPKTACAAVLPAVLLC